VPGRRPPSAFAATMCSLRSSPRSSIGQTGSRSNGISSGARATLQAFDVMVLPGGYPNLLAGGDADRVAKSYGPNAQRGQSQAALRSRQRLQLRHSIASQSRQAVTLTRRDWLITSGVALSASAIAVAAQAVDVLAHFDRVAIGVTRRWPKVRIECGGKR
jgi:hypothetical protein